MCFYKVILVCLSRSLAVLWNRAGVLLAYLSLGVSLRVVVEEEGEGWTIASTAPSVLGSSPRRDGPSPPPPSHSPSPSTQRAAAPLSPSNHFATPRHPRFFPPRPSHRCFSNLPMAFSVRPTMTDLQPKFAPRIFYRVAKSFHESQSCANDFVNLSASHILPQLNIINIKSIVLKKNVSLWLINVRFPLERELSKSS